MARSLPGTLKNTKTGVPGRMWTGRQVLIGGLLGLILAPGLLLATFCAWAYLIKDPASGYNVGYVFWTKGMNPGFPATTAVGNMAESYNDWARQITFEQFQERVGYVIPLAQAKWIQGCASTPNGDASVDPAPYAGVPYDKRPGAVYSIRDLKWMIRVDHDRVVDMFFCNED